MKELFQRIKLDVIISAVCCILFGIVLLIWPVQVTTVTCKAIGGAIAFLGILKIISYIMNTKEKNGVNLPLGMVLFFVGAWIFLKPGSIQSLLLIGIGVVLFVHGFEDLKYAIETKRNGFQNWWVIFLFAVFGMGLGAACIVDCFGMISVTMTFVGIVLIYDGITDLWIIAQVVKTAKEIKEEVEIFQDSDIEVVDAEIVTKEKTD